MSFCRFLSMKYLKYTFSRNFKSNIYKIFYEDNFMIVNSVLLRAQAVSAIFYYSLIKHIGSDRKEQVQVVKWIQSLRIIVIS